ncbi:MAG: ComEC family competence protein [Deltaproteobacteria bacterium]|nr:ComEC family competence protein [Deltaproteobacteria bacterium]
MDRQPLVPVAIFFIIGIIAASYQFLNNTLAFPLLLAALLLSLLSIAQKRRFNLLFICAMFFLLGAILAGQAIHPNLPNHHIRKVVEEKQLIRSGKNEIGTRIEGVLSGAPEKFPDETRLYLDAEKIYLKDNVVAVTGRVLVTIRDADVKVKYGDRIRFIAKLRIPRNFGNPGEFDYAGNLAREGIYVTGHVESGRWIAVIGGNEKHGLKTSIEQIRDKIRYFIDWSGVRNSAVIKALILGEKGEISKAVRDAFAGTGTAHILAISGLHIGIIAFVSYWIILQILKQSERFMLAFDIRKIAAASSIVPVLLYGAIAGFSVSTQRSVIMVMVFILSVIIDRRHSLYNTLATAAFVILIVSPLSIYDISFQLSFISVLAIIYLVPKFQGLWANKQGADASKLLPSHPAAKLLKNYLLNPLAVSIAASIGTAPFIAWHFHRVSIIGIPANIIAVPLMGFIAVPFGLISSLVSFFYLPLADLILKLSDIILKVSLWIVNMFARLPYASVYTTTPTILEAVLFYLLIICIVEFKKARFFKYGLATVILVLIGNYSYLYYHLNYNPNLKVTFISVGQGDSALVEFPYGIYCRKVWRK